MIELKRADIEALAISKFSWSTRYKFLGFMGGVLAVMVVLALLISDDAAIWLKIVAFVPVFIGLFYGVVRYLRAQHKAVKELVAQCEAEPELRYVRPEAEKKGK